MPLLGWKGTQIQTHEPKRYHYFFKITFIYFKSQILLVSIKAMKSAAPRKSHILQYTENTALVEKMVPLSHHNPGISNQSASSGPNCLLCFQPISLQMCVGSPEHVCPCHPCGRPGISGSCFWTGQCSILRSETVNGESVYGPSLSPYLSNKIFFLRRRYWPSQNSLAGPQNRINTPSL